MSLPPTNIEPAALWLQLQRMPRPQREVDFPRRDPITGEMVGRIVIRVLTEAETMSAAAAAEEHTVKVVKKAPSAGVQSNGYDTIYANESSIQILFRSVRRVEMDLPFFPSPNAMRDELTNDELGALMRQYLLVQRELGPIVSSMPTEAVDAWIDVLVKGASSAPLALLDSEARDELTMAMAYRLHSFSTGTTSAGSPPDDTSSESQDLPHHLHTPTRARPSGDAEG